jgi:hypothetical protein
MQARCSRYTPLVTMLHPLVINHATEVHRRIAMLLYTPYHARGHTPHHATLAFAFASTFAFAPPTCLLCASGFLASEHFSYILELKAKVRP